jgi:hypothetical protein
MLLEHYNDNVALPRINLYGHYYDTIIITNYCTYYYSGITTVLYDFI